MYFRLPEREDPLRFMYLYGYLQTPLTIYLWFRYKVKSLFILGENGMKAERELKVYEISGYRYRPTPTIRLQGQWLKKYGFDIGNRIMVHCEDGMITIMPLIEEKPQSQDNSGAKKQKRLRKK